ncbi:MAG: hypothetical protein NVS3B12_09720 [Acidimicrobiales bacterium]
MLVALLGAGVIAAFTVRSLTGGFDQATTQNRREITPLFRVRTEISAATGVSVILGEPGANDRFIQHQKLVTRRFGEVAPFVTPSEAVAFDTGRASWEVAGTYIANWSQLAPIQRVAPAAARVKYVELVVATRTPLDAAIAVAQQRGGQRLADAHNLERRAGWLLGGAALLGLLGALSVAVRLHRSVLRPLADLQVGMRALGEGNLDYRFPTQPNAELQAVAVALDAMADRIGDHRDELSHLARHDPLTGLPNRLHLYEFLDGIMNHADRPPVGVLLLDLDGFKEVNDTLGHHHGDELLRLVGPRIAAAIRTEDFVARAGGDEFTVVMTSSTGARAPSSFEEISHRVIDAFSAPFVVGNLSLVIGVSGGLAVFPDHGHDVAGIMRRADMAMYAAKRGRIGLVTYDPAYDHNTPAKLTLISELSTALEKSELVLHYQPIIDLASDLPCGVEALVRWNHPVRGLIMPDEFIPFAETSGLIHQLTRLVLSEALAQQQRWAAAGRQLPVSVNLSALSLLDRGLPEMVAGALHHARVAASLLTLEITETALIGDQVRASELLNELAKLGVHVSIDDFGTGYTSMANLRDMPVHELKIDKRFTRHVITSSQDRAIVQTVLDLARRLTMSAVAEGVEDQATADELRSMGCPSAQGYFFSRPIPAEAFLRWLQQGQSGSRATPPLLRRVL